MTAMRCAEHDREMSQLGDKAVCFACLGKASKGASQLWASFGERTARAAVAARLRDAGIDTSYRISRARDIGGACGQLAAPVDAARRRQREDNLARMKAKDAAPA